MDLTKHAQDVQAILINPPWEHCRATKDSKNPKSLSMSAFQRLVLPTSVLKDGLIFIWVEKEIISDVIKFMESQDIQYVENVCYIMLDL